jgi:hypothetical protein
MFIKLTRAGGHTYAQLVESFRDEHGKPRQRTVATLGRVDESGGQVDALLNGLLRSKGRPAASSTAPQLRFESALALGARVRHQPPQVLDLYRASLLACHYNKDI